TSTTVLYTLSLHDALPICDIEVQEGTINGTPVVVERDSRAWEIDRQVEATASYPFSRVQRVELGLGFRNLSFPTDQEIKVYNERSEEHTSELQSQSNLVCR